MTGAPGMNIVVVGAGYVGLVCGACFAQWGNRVTCVDIDADRIRRLNAGDVPIHEPGLEPLIAANVRAARRTHRAHNRLRGARASPTDGEQKTPGAQLGRHQRVQARPVNRPAAVVRAA